MFLQPGNSLEKALNFVLVEVYEPWLKGYWQVPLTQQARKISTFVAPSGLYQYKVRTRSCGLE